MSAGVFRERAEDGSRRLRNMSAPPRMTVELHPLPIGGRGARGGAGGRGRILAAVDSRRLVGRYLQGWRETFLNKLEDDPRRKAMLLAGFAAGKEPGELLPVKAEDEIYDLFMKMAGSVDISPYGLPPFAVAVAAPRAMRRRVADSVVDDPKLAVALLSRISGLLFLRNRAPHLPPRNFLAGLAIFYDTTGGECHG